MNDWIGRWEGDDDEKVMMELNAHALTCLYYLKDRVSRRLHVLSLLSTLTDSSSKLFGYYDPLSSRMLFIDCYDFLELLWDFAVCTKVWNSLQQNDARLLASHLNLQMKASRAKLSISIELIEHSLLVGGWNFCILHIRIVDNFCQFEMSPPTPER